MGDSGRDSRHIWQELLHMLPSGVILFDASGRALEANPAAQAALGHQHPHGLTLRQLFRDATLAAADGTPLGPAATVLRDATRGQRTLQRQTMRYTTPAGEGRHLGLTVFPLRRGEGRAPGLACLLTDLTAVRALEEEVQRRRSLSALGEMAAGIAHEFKNGLATISGYGQMLRGHADDRVRGQAEHLLNQVALLNEVATEFLVFARPLSLQPEPVALGPLLRRCTDGLRVLDFPGVALDLEGDFPAVLGDPNLLAAAFTNLLRNACEALSAERRPGTVSIRYRPGPRDQACILVEDDGPGVPAEVAEKIFIPFFTTKPCGTGLGLPMVHKIVAAHRGSVLLADAAAGHTVFEVRLPLAAAARAAGGHA